jgi:hypothetical protein
MQKFKYLKLFTLLLGLTLPAAWYNTNGTNLTDGYSHIQIKESGVQGAPKGSTIQATIDGHTLTVVFTENLGQVAVEITTASGASVEYLWVHTPNGIQTYLPLNGDYIITFTLPNGDEYYGEFTVTD